MKCNGHGLSVSCVEWPLGYFKLRDHLGVGLSFHHLSQPCLPCAGCGRPWAPVYLKPFAQACLTFHGCFKFGLYVCALQQAGYLCAYWPVEQTNSFSLSLKLAADQVET